MRTVLDTEFSTSVTPSGKKDFSPYNPGNKLVTVQWTTMGEDFSIGTVESEFFHHREMSLEERSHVPARRAKLQAILDKTTLLIGHNIKIDLQWLLECGFRYEGAVYDTMICEYVMARGQEVDLTLEATAHRHGVQLKKSDLIQSYYDQGIQMDEIPREIVDEYGKGDIVSTAQVYLKQRKLLSDPKNRGLIPTIQMSNEYTLVLTDMERAGLKIDLDTLKDIERQYIEEKVTLEKRLNEIVFQVMGDTPVNLSSPEMLSWVVYSRKLRDKKDWKDTFNLGRDDKGNEKKRPRMSDSKFKAAVKVGTIPLYRTKARQCPDCQGAGYIYKTKKDGSQYAKPNKCKTCTTKAFNEAKDQWEDRPTGLLYDSLKVRAGFKFEPTDIDDVSANGFSTAKDVLKRLAEEARVKGDDLALEFLEGMVRLNALDSYLSTFVNGIQNGVQEDGRIHPTFNQTVTATGRLSHSNPNFGNMPRGDTFPVKRCIVSRFEGGKIIDADFSGLEFRGAAELSKCPVATADILNGKDIHKQTASIVYQKPEEEVTKIERQSSKKWSFSPLYGGKGANEAAHVKKYFSEFFNIYTGVNAWHEDIKQRVLSTKVLSLPSGRQFSWPDAERTTWGGVSYATQIVNYPVQSHATADVVPTAIISVWREFRARGLRSLIVNCVHDSAVVDCHPDELNEVAAILFDKMINVDKEFLRRYGYEMTVPLNVEVKAGDNWLEGEELPRPEFLKEAA